MKSKRPRLLMLTHRFPYPPNRGDRIRSYHLLRVLSEAFSVSLACTTDETISDADRAHVNEKCEQLKVASLETLARHARASRRFAFGRSLTEGMFSSPELARTIRRWQKQSPFDAVLVFCSSMYPFVDNAVFRDTRTVVDLVDVDSQKWLQMAGDTSFPKKLLYQIEAKRVGRLEQRIAQSADAVTLVSDAEADLFISLLARSQSALSSREPHPDSTRPPVRIHGIPNGVDIEYFGARGQDAHGQSTPLATADSQRSTSPPTLLFTGVLDYAPNVEGMQWFCREVLPRLASPVQVQIVGRRPSRKVQQLGRLPGVDVVGEVPDMRPYLQAADLAIAPLHLARGIQNKVLEAMASGLPVVTTSQAAEGIEATHGIHFWVADSVAQWKHAIETLSADEATRSKMGKQAQAVVRQKYSWSGRLGRFISLLAPQLQTRPETSEATSREVMA